MIYLLTCFDTVTGESWTFPVGPGAEPFATRPGFINII